MKLNNPNLFESQTQETPALEVQIEFTACITLFSLSFLFENRRIRFDEFSKDQFLARKNVKKTTSFTLFWKAEMIRSQPIRIHRKQYKYLEDHFRGTNNNFIQGEVKVMFIHKSNAGFLLQGGQRGTPLKTTFAPLKFSKKQ